MVDLQNRPWLKIYPKGVPADVDFAKYQSLGALIADTCKRFADKPAFSNMGHAMSFAEVDEKSRQLAAFFQNDLGLKRGDRIVIQMPNLLQYPVALFAALRAGLVVVNMNPLYTADEMAYPMKDSGARVAIVLENFADKLEAVLKKQSIEHVILTEIGDLFPTPKRLITNFVVRYVKKMVPAHGLTRVIRYRDALARGAGSKFQEPALSHGDLAFLQYTGGTTGVSKAAMLTHRNLLANLAQMLTWMKPAMREGQETVIAALPLYHVFCLTVNAMGLFHYGAHNVLITNPKDFPAFLKTIHENKPSVMSAVSTLLGALMTQKEFDSVDFSPLKFVVAGGMALKGSVAEEWRRRTQSTVIEGYGLTEASPIVSCNPLDGTDRLGTIGLPVSNTMVKLVDEEGKPVPVGQPGELCVHGPQVMQGYWNQPEETRKVLDSEGWLHTGDMAVMEPDGFFKIVDRKKDMILVSGFNVYPNEIEDVVMRHPKVLEAAAIGIPDDHSGEVVKLFIVKRDPSLTAEEVKAYCHEHLTGYKCPKQVEFRPDLPKTNVGKILRRQLRG